MSSYISLAPASVVLPETRGLKLPKLVPTGMFNPARNITSSALSSSMEDSGGRNNVDSSMLSYKRRPFSKRRDKDNMTVGLSPDNR